MARKLAAVAVALLGLGMLAGCAPSGDTGVEPTTRQTESRLLVEVVQLPDDSTVDCVWISQSGVSCDWDTRG